MASDAAVFGVFLFGLLSATSLLVGQASVNTRPPSLGWVWHTNEYGADYDEADIRRQADGLVSSGLAAKGFNLLTIEDTWSACDERSGSLCLRPSPRDLDGRLRANSTRFPSGIAGIAAYVHSKGLRFGLYTSMGNQTCTGYAGSWGHEMIDAATFVDWGVDWVFHDSCFWTSGYNISRGGRDPELIVTATIRMREGLDTATNRTGKSQVVYYADVGNLALLPRMYAGGTTGHLSDATWPVVQTPMQADAFLPHKWALGVVDELKTYYDLEGSWASMMDNVAAAQEMRFMQRPGFYHCPDNHLFVGLRPHAESTYFLTLAEQRTQLSLWSVLAAPMLIGFDVANASEDILSMVGNVQMIAISQDAGGVQGSLVRSLIGDQATWVKPLASGAFAVAMVNTDDYRPTDLTITFGRNPGDYKGRVTSDFAPAVFECARVVDVWSRKDYGLLQDKFTARNVDPHDTSFVMVSPSGCPADPIKV